MAFVDITPVSRERGGEAAMLADDGLHPSAAMYTQWTALALAGRRAGCWRDEPGRLRHRDDAARRDGAVAGQAGTRARAAPSCRASTGTAAATITTPASKLGSDPLYPGVCEALRGTDAPLLDLGCGLGLLAHALARRRPAHALSRRRQRRRQDLRARKAAARCDLGDAQFDTVDLADGVPAHRGSVAMLDVLQFIPEAAQMQRDRCRDRDAHARREAGDPHRPGRRQQSRARHALHRCASPSVVGWMNAAPLHYPDADALRARLAAAGLQATFTPLHGNTPFNNWLIVAG